MGLKKSIEKGNTRQTNEYWKNVGVWIDDKGGKVHITLDGFKDQETRDSGADNDDSRLLIFDIADVFTKKQMDSFKTMIYKASVKSQAEFDEVKNEETGEMEQVQVNEKNPFVGAEEA